MYSETCLERPPLEDHPAWKDPFLISETVYQPLVSMQTEPVYNYHLSGMMTFLTSGLVVPDSQVLDNWKVEANEPYDLACVDCSNPTLITSM